MYKKVLDLVPMSFKYLSIGKVLKIQEKIYELEKILSLTDNAVCGTAPRPCLIN